MSEDQAKIAGEIDELAKAIITAHVQFVNEHRDIDNASVVTAIALFVAITVDTLSYEKDDPSQAEVMTLLTEEATEMLKHSDVIRDYMAKILRSVVGEEPRQ